MYSVNRRDWCFFRPFTSKIEPSVHGSIVNLLSYLSSSVNRHTPFTGESYYRCLCLPGCSRSPFRLSVNPCSSGCECTDGVYKIRVNMSILVRTLVCGRVHSFYYSHFDSYGGPTVPRRLSSLSTTTPDSTSSVQPLSIHSSYR